MTKKISAVLGMFGVAAMLVLGTGCATTSITLDDLCANCLHVNEPCTCRPAARCNPKCLCTPENNCVKLSQTVHESQLLGNWNADDVPGDAEASLQFLADKRVAGRSGVNSFDSSYTFTGRNSIHFMPLRLTRMFGSDEAMKYEQEFVRKMESVTSFKVDKKTLELYDAGGNLVLSFSR